MLKKIRMSSLPTYNDCARLASTTVKIMDPSNGRELNLPELYNMYGFEPRKPGRKAHIGTALHKGMEHILNAKLNGEEVDLDAARNAMLTACREGFDETEEDDSCRSVEVAEGILNNIWPVAVEKAMSLQPLAVEMAISHAFNSDTIGEGHLDALYKTPCSQGVGDWKSTGANTAKPHPAQIGGYALLLKKMGIEVDEAETWTFQRLKTKPVSLITTKYDVIETMKFAEATIERFAANADRFIATGDPNSFNANPGSSLCSAKYCPAWGTDYCTVGRK